MLHAPGGGRYVDRVDRDRLLLGCLFGACVGCTVPHPPAKLPSGPYVAVLSGEMPPPLDRVARHAWIVVQPADGPLHRYEYGGGGGSDDPFDDFAAGDVMLHGVVPGTPEEIAALDGCLSEASKEYYRLHPVYFPIPGPNSNTFVAHLDRTCELDIELPASAIGRDYVGIVGASVTESGTGVQIGSAPFGVRIGLVEGVGVQFFGLPLGIHFFPPGIDLPVNPGRIGFATDGHVSRPRRDRDSPFPEEPARTGAASIGMYAGGMRVVHPDLANGVSGEGLVGISARVVYGKYVGYGAGFDLEMGVADPAAFAGRAHLYPVGIGVLLSPTGFFGVFGGVGASAIAGYLSSAVELPVEARFEIDIGPRARITVFAREAFAFGPEERQQGLFDLGEATVGVRARFGDGWGFYQGSFGSGLFVAAERRELAGSAMIGLFVGTEVDAGYSARPPVGL